jgi:cytochrome c553
MTPRIKTSLLSLGLAALVAGCGHHSNISKQLEPGIANEKMASLTDSKPDEFVTACVVCHSPRYITMQPQFSRTTWLSEVNKMKDVYGAHISNDQVLKITAYLVSINGTPDAGQAPKGTYGE